MTYTFNPQLPQRRLPMGIPSFEMTRREGYLYVDKTDLVWNIAHGAMFNFLSRPRRFGKSMLLDTLGCYFEGKRALFEGLRIMQMETEWKEYPVVRLDMSGAGTSAETIRSYLHNAFRKLEKRWELLPDPGDSFAVRFSNILEAAHAKTGLGVAVLIDEYDSPLQHSWHTPEHEQCVTLYREVFSVLKSASLHERFVFITGVTKFTQLSLFSVLNNLCILSFDAVCATACGITEQEIRDNFMPEIARMAERNEWTVEQTFDKLRERYDGYHFSRDNWTGVYNPYSLICALSKKDILNFWVSSGRTQLLEKFAPGLDWRIRTLDGCHVDRDLLETSDVTTASPEQFLYQTGYLTLKGTGPSFYTLTIPNEEVRKALYGFVLPALCQRERSEVMSEQTMLRCYLDDGELDDAMRTLQALIADAPYSNKKLASVDMEERYRFLVSSVLHAIGLRTEVERMKSRGRIDIVSWTPRRIYVFELKLKKNGGLADAVRQIKEKDYAAPFRADIWHRPVQAVAVELDDEGKGILRWEAVE